MTKELETLGKKLENATPEEIVFESYEHFKEKVVATSSFGVTSGALINLIWKVGLPIKIVYINTGFLFKETIDYIELLKSRYKELEFVELKPEISKDELLKIYGNDLPLKNADLCCRINKIEPLKKYFNDNNIMAWITGIRADQTETRKDLNVITQTKNGLYKISPYLRWSSKMIYYYMKSNEVPFHPLFEKGYTSIGCEPCTDLPTSDDERSGRWKGLLKKECGLHTDL